MTEKTKDEFHKWGRTILSIATVVFACGMAYTNIGSNTRRVENCEKRDEHMLTEINEIKINQQKEIALKEAMLSTLTEIKGDVKDAKNGQQGLKTSVQVLSSKMENIANKVNNLERAE